MRFTHTHEVIRTTFPKDEDLSTGLVQDDAWEGADEAEASWNANDTATEAARVQETPEANNLIAQYFGDVRRFALLSFTEEQALGHRIEDYKARERRTLYISPVALPTLTRLWHQVTHAEIPLRQVVRAVDAAADPTEQCAQLGEAIEHLQGLATRLQRLARPYRVPLGSAQKRRRRRQTRVSLWYQWIAACEALQLHPNVYEGLRMALDVAQRTRPNDPTLHVAHSAWVRAQQRLEQAKAQMLRANLRLVIHVAQRYGGRGVPFLDLVQEGNLGLMRALEKFEPQRGLKFVTYAHWWVRQAISRAIIEQHSTIRLPSHVVERKNKLRTVSSKLWDVHGRAPSAQELSAALGWTPKEVEDTLAASQSITRLHQPITDDGGMLADVLEDPQAPKPEDLVVEEQLHQRLAECLAGLPEREAMILRLRYGMGTDHPHSLQEIGAILGISRERVRQLEKLALEKLRQPQQRAHLEDFTEAA